MRRHLLLAASLTLDAAVFAVAVLALGAWFFGLLPAIMGAH